MPQCQRRMPQLATCGAGGNRFHQARPHPHARARRAGHRHRRARQPPTGPLNPYSVQLLQAFTSLTRALQA